MVLLWRIMSCNSHNLTFPPCVCSGLLFRYVYTRLKARVESSGENFNNNERYVVIMVFQMPGQRKKFPPEFWLEYFKYESQRGRLWEKQGKKLSKPRDKWNKIAYENEIWTAPSAELFCFSFLCQSERKNGNVMMASFASFTPKKSSQSNKMESWNFFTKLFWGKQLFYVLSVPE